MISRTTPVVPPKRCVKSRTLPQIPMDRGIGPILRACDQSMLDRIDQAILHMRRHVRRIANMMFPKPSLPNAPLLPRNMATSQVSLWQRTRKSRLDQPPPRREIVVATRQCPDAMQVVGQNDPSVDLKGPLRPGRGNRAAQYSHMVNKQTRPPLLQGYGEEHRGSRNLRSDIVRHAAI